MERRPILSYAIAWNPNGNRAFVTLRLEGGQQIQVPINAAEELSAIAAVLRLSPVFLYPDGTIGSGWENVDAVGR